MRMNFRFAEDDTGADKANALLKRYVRCTATTIDGKPRTARQIRRFIGCDPANLTDALDKILDDLIILNEGTMQ